MSKKMQTGYSAEQWAAEFLENKQYTILERNYRHQKGELDLIAQQGNMLVFVEVRFRSNLAYGLPEQTISQSKKRLLIKTALAYIYAVNWQGAIRFDIIAITLAGASPKIDHFEDAFGYE